MNIAEKTVENIKLALANLEEHEMEALARAMDMLGPQLAGAHSFARWFVLLLATERQRRITASDVLMPDLPLQDWTNREAGDCLMVMVAMLEAFPNSRQQDLITPVLMFIAAEAATRLQFAPNVPR